jgi:hypothetical protein
MSSLILGVFGRDGAGRQQLGRHADRRQRAAQLVAQDRDEFIFPAVRTLQGLRLFVEQHIEGLHAGIGLFQAGRQRDQVILAQLQRGERIAEVAVLLARFRQGHVVRQDREPGDELRDRRRRHRLCVGGKYLAQGNARALAGRGDDVAAVHQPARGQDAQAHSRARPVAAAEDDVEHGDARSVVGHVDVERLAAPFFGHRIAHRSGDRVIDDVARQFGHRGSDAGLVECAEAAQGGKLARPLARGDDVELAIDRDRQDRPHRRARRSARARGWFMELAHTCGGLFARGMIRNAWLRN